MIPQKLNRIESAVTVDRRLSLRFYQLLDALVDGIYSSSTSGGSSVTTSTTITGTSATLFCDATAGAIVITLPAVALMNYYNIIKTDSSANTVTVSAADGIIGSLTQVLNSQYDSIECIVGPTEYYIR